VWCGKLIGFYSKLFYGGKEIGKGTLRFLYQSRILLRRNNICGYALSFCSSEEKNRCVWLSLCGKEIYLTILNKIVRRMVFFLSLMIWDSQRFCAIPWVRERNLRLFPSSHSNRRLCTRVLLFPRRGTAGCLSYKYEGANLSVVHYSNIRILRIFS